MTIAVSIPEPPRPAHSRQKIYLREWRKFRGLSQVQAAERLGIKQSTLSKIERRQLPYGQDLLERAALAYEASKAADLLTIDPLAARENDISVSPILEELGDRLRKARGDRFASAAEAARYFGLSESTYRAHENGQNSFNVGQCAIYAKAYGVSPSWLAWGKASS